MTTITIFLFIILLILLLILVLIINKKNIKYSYGGTNTDSIGDEIEEIDEDDQPIYEAILRYYPFSNDLISKIGKRNIINNSLRYLLRNISSSDISNLNLVEENEVDKINSKLDELKLELELNLEENLQFDKNLKINDNSTLDDEKLLKFLLDNDFISQQSYDQIKKYQETIKLTLIKIRKSVDILSSNKNIPNKQNIINKKVIDMLIINCKNSIDIFNSIIDIEKQLSKYKIIDPYFKDIIQTFISTDKCLFEKEGKTYMVAIHINGPPDRNAILNLNNFVNPNMTLDKPASIVLGHLEQYLWGSTNPIFSKNSWIKMCRKSHRDYLHGDWYYIIIDMDNILNIKTREDLIQFNSEYSPSPFEIEWGKVSQNYSGVSIMDYTINPGNTWLNLWEVDSVVIWNPRSIVYIQQLKSVEKKIYLYQI